MGATFAFGCVTALWFVVLPIGLLLAGIVWRRVRVAGAPGAIVGIGLVVAVLGAVNLGNRACTDGSTAFHGTLKPGGPARVISNGCGGINGTVWLITGTVLILGTVALMTWRRSADNTTRASSA